jgi:hypothetical protein
MPTAANKACAPGTPGLAMSYLADAPDCMHRLRLEAPDALIVCTQNHTAEIELALLADMMGGD